MSEQTDKKLQEEELINTEEEGVEITNAEADADAEAVENEFDLLQTELTSLKDKYARVHAAFCNSSTSVIFCSLIILKKD